MRKIYFVILSTVAIFTGNAAKAQTEYKDVAPIFYSRCTSCHHENQHAPSMMNYSQTMANSTNMLTNLQTNKMPPWPPDTAYTRLNHEHLITDAEKNTLLDWISHGFTQGDTSLAPTPPSYPQYQLNGTPDLVLSIGVFASNANAADAYNCFSIPTNLTQNRILRAFEIVPGNAEIVHHVVVDVDTLGTGVSDLSGTCYSNTGSFTLGFYVPGAAPTVYPSQAPLKTGVIIKAGSKFRLQMHYPSGSLGQLDSTKIRLYFYPIGTTGVRPIYTTVPLQNWSLNIPANTTRTFAATYTLPGTISLFGVGPHSHTICTSLINYAYLGTDTIPEIRINNWQFTWQGFYSFPNLIKIPTGYTLRSSHFYDNTAANPDNPFSPPHNILAGTSTSNEMLFDAIQYLYYQTGDELIDVAAILANDPLLNNINETPAASFTSYAYPNPATDKINVYVSKKGDYKISLFDVTGQLVFQTKSSDEVTSIDTKNIAPGVYILEIADTKLGEKTSKKVVKD